METEWTTVSKRNKAQQQQPQQPPKHTHSAEYIQDVRANKVYAKREFPAGVTVSKPIEPMVAKGGSVFSSRLRTEVEQARVPVENIRDTVSFETKPSPYKNAALNAVKQEKIRQANAAIAAVAAKSETSNPILLQPLSYRSSKPPPVRVDEYSFQPDDDQGFDDTDIVRTRKMRVQPTQKFQSVSRVSHVTAIHRSAIEIVEPAEDPPPDNSTEHPDYE